MSRRKPLTIWYSDGWYAHKDNILLEQNPHEKFSKAFKDWRSGWLSRDNFVLAIEERKAKLP